MEHNIGHLIEVRRLGKEYRAGESVVHAIRQMDFTIDDGEFVSIMGPSGSGKSTLLSVLGGLNHPTSGSVHVDSLDIYALTNEQRADFRSEYLGIVFQSFQLIPYLTVLENIKLPMAVTGVRDRDQQQRALSILERVGLANKAHRLPDQLSGGEQERVAIARGHREPSPDPSGGRADGESGQRNGGRRHGAFRSFERRRADHYDGNPQSPDVPLRIANDSCEGRSRRSRRTRRESLILSAEMSRIKI